MTDYQHILESIRRDVQPLLGKGKVASYIPALKNTDPKKFGIALETLAGQECSIGDANERFSIQSISKVFTLTMAFAMVGEELWKRVGIEPSGSAFNSLVQLEYEKGKPRNPFINAGALVVTDVLIQQLPDPKAAILDFVRKLSGIPDIGYDFDIARSERETGFTNTALVNFLKSHGNIVSPIEQVLDVYFHQCAIMMSCRELAKAFLYLANHGVIPATGERILTNSQAKRLNAVMMTCGFYDEAGEFAFRVGMPGKSGVGGGIVSVIPTLLAIAVWSPELNERGNSVAGVMALELFTTRTGRSIF
ncbi:MAG: glutaminase [Saprospiraceae bacterium]|nr:glutaminase [Saprospiraceae bacterium]MDZ4704792.1 glutaminase [Saprospiraceae bacterium]